MNDSARNQVPKGGLSIWGPLMMYQGDYAVKLRHICALKSTLLFLLCTFHDTQNKRSSRGKNPCKHFLWKQWICSDPSFASKHTDETVHSGRESLLIINGGSFLCALKQTRVCCICILSTQQQLQEQQYWALYIRLLDSHTRKDRRLFLDNDHDKEYQPAECSCEILELSISISGQSSVEDG